MRAKAQAAPGFGDDDAVGRVVRVVTDLDGKVGADIADVIGKQSDVLGALIGDAADTVVVNDDERHRVRVVLLQRGLGDAAIGDAARGCEKVAAVPFNLLSAWSGPPEGIPRNAHYGGGADPNRKEIARRTKLER